MSHQNINPRFPKGRTAFFLIHGVGEQNPFETMDYFARNLLQYFDKQSLPFKLEHLIAKRRLANGSFWTESFVRVSPSDSEQNWIIDIHEYYWAPNTENKISVPELLQWAEQALDGTIKFYNRQENKDLLQRLLVNNKRKGLFQFRLRSLTIFLRLFNLVYPVLRLGIWLILLFAGPFLRGRFLQSAWKLSKQIVTPVLVNFVGDVAIYSITDPKSPYQKIRQQILAESLTLLKAILKDKEANYDQVILAGHSLGSCIAYDTLNLLCIESTLGQNKSKNLLLDKIKGLITFGSPLDKIAFFLRETAQQDQYIRQRMLEHLNSFRVKPEFALQSPYMTKNPVICQLEQINWVNYYHLKDPISGHLDYYENLDNVEMKYHASWGLEGHMGYWTDPSFYENITERFLYTSNQDKDNQKFTQKVSYNQS
ncbi:hypothetical protein I8752_04335 [Nostocaceae cyanobacterium CENA369]|uniref:Uncharacterized protein n=1 Tax=Dendronalium phyllosphericum CENA369 TaxID=1725256 RepID=A0A8J7LCS7_9NOST|nr:hypothetical protein [Dendronalium phyllosphericum]MBH8572276.1 hypothetical protein [Dendronalium phyllosphericum CENA369]